MFFFGTSFFFFAAAVYFVKHVQKYRRKIICSKMRRRMPKCVCEAAAEQSGRRRAHIPTCVQICLFGKMIFIFIICSCYVFSTGGAHALALTFTISCFSHFIYCVNVTGFHSVIKYFFFRSLLFVRLQWGLVCNDAHYISASLAFAREGVTMRS